METKFAVALLRGERETILGLFDTKAEADRYGARNIVPYAAGLQYCFEAKFINGIPIGNIKVYDYYNV